MTIKVVHVKTKYSRGCGVGHWGCGVAQSGVRRSTMGVRPGKSDEDKGTVIRRVVHSQCGLTPLHKTP